MSQFSYILSQNLRFTSPLPPEVEWHEVRVRKAHTNIDITSPSITSLDPPQVLNRKLADREVEYCDLVPVEELVAVGTVMDGIELARASEGFAEAALGDIRIAIRADTWSIRKQWPLIETTNVTVSVPNPEAPLMTTLTSPVTAKWTDLEPVTTLRVNGWVEEGGPDIDSQTIAGFRFTQDLIGRIEGTGQVDSFEFDSDRSTGGFIPASMQLRYTGPISYSPGSADFRPVFGSRDAVRGTTAVAADGFDRIENLAVVHGVVVQVSRITGGYISIRANHRETL